MNAVHSNDRCPTQRPAPTSRLMVRMNATMFYCLGAACLLEAVAAAHGNRVLAVAEHDAALSNWIETVWLPEKEQRAGLLQAYVQGMWPEVDWSRATAEMKEALANQRPGTRTAVQVALAHGIAAVQASIFYRCLSRCADDVVLRQLARQCSQSEAGHFSRFKQAFEHFQRHGRLGFWAGFREALLQLQHARDRIVRNAFDILQGQWVGTPPFADLAYGEFLARAGSVARSADMLAWPHRVLLRPWFRQPSQPARSRNAACPPCRPPARSPWPAPMPRHCSARAA